MANTFVDKWSFTSFGESHGAAIGGVLDGVPAGLHIDIAMIREELLRRAGKQGAGVSPRAVREPDEVEWLSGVTQPGSFSTKQVPTGVENVQGDKVQSTKVLIDGNLYIVGEHVYDASGVMVK